MPPKPRWYWPVRRGALEPGVEISDAGGLNAEVARRDTGAPRGPRRGCAGQATDHAGGAEECGRHLDAHVSVQRDRSRSDGWPDSAKVGPQATPLCERAY